MNSKLQVMDENNEMVEIQVIDFFQLEEYDHEYILYTKNEEVDNDNIITYVSIIKQPSENEFYFERITDPEEERKLDELIQKEIEEVNNDQY